MKNIQQLFSISTLAIGLVAFMIHPNALMAQRHSQASQEYYGSSNSSSTYHDDAHPSRKNRNYYHKSRTQGRYVRKISKQAEKFKMGKRTFYMSKGIFYKRVKRGYVTVPAPIGLQVKRVPKNAKRIDIGRSTYYEANGTYYLDIPRKRKFEVVSRPVRRATKAPRGRNYNRPYECRPVKSRR